MLQSEAALLTAGELVERYLVPLARLPELAHSIREGERVTHVAREDLGKGGGSGREGRGFLLRVEAADGAPRFDPADIVVDATGVYGHPNATGPGGRPALGEDRIDDALARHIVPRLDSADGPYARGSTLLIGDGHSAANAMAVLETLAREDKQTSVTWVVRTARQRPCEEVANDPLPERHRVVSHANISGSSWPNPSTPIRRPVRATTGVAR